MSAIIEPGIDFSSLVRRHADGSSEITFALEGVNCGGCVSKIESSIAKLPQVTNARVNFGDRRITVRWRDNDQQPGLIAHEIEKLGYRAHPFVKPTASDDDSQAKWLLRCLAVAGFAAMNIMLLSVSVWSGNVTDITQETRDLFHWISALIALPAAAYAGQPFFLSAIRALRAGSVNMDVPISLGVILALGMSLVETALHARHAYFDSAIMLLFFLLIGRYLDQVMRRKTSTVAGNLSAFRAEIANRIVGAKIKVVPLAALQAGDMILVKPGERIPADGIVVSGESEIDESLVTGETSRRAVRAKSALCGGSINFHGALTIKVTAVGESSFLAEVEKLLAAAVDRKSHYVQLADRVASYYAPVVHVTAAVTAVGWLIYGANFHDSIITAISVLIITCPCALALAIPAVQVVASEALFRSGILLHSGDALERLAEIDTIVFDKTGTLTLPEPRLVNRDTIDCGILKKAGRLALASRHPLARVLAQEAAELVPYEGAVEESGRGIRLLLDGNEARLGSLEFCGIDPSQLASIDPGSSLLGFRWGDCTQIFEIRQRLRPDAQETIRALKRWGFRLAILSGDREDPVEKVAKSLGISEWHARSKPADKIAYIESLKQTGRKTLMVGDGLNDAPALAAASVSMSPITASDLTQMQADAVFLGERLIPVLHGVLAAKRARRLMRQNLQLAIVYNIFAIPLAIAGYATPLVAALAMSGSSILVTANAMRAGFSFKREVGQAQTEKQPVESFIAQAVRS